MFDSEYSPDNFKTLTISIGIITKIPEMLKFIPDYLKTKNMCKNPVKNLSFVKR